MDSKRIAAVLLSVLLVAITVCGCDKNDNANRAESEKGNVVSEQTAEEKEDIKQETEEIPEEKAEEKQEEASADDIEPEKADEENTDKETTAEKVEVVSDEEYAPLRAEIESELKKFINFEQYKLQDETNSSTYKSFRYTVHNEFLKDVPFCEKVLFDGEEPDLSVNCSEFEEQGWALNEEKADTLVSPGKGYIISSTHKSGKRAGFTFKNKTDENVTVKELTLCNVIIHNNNNNPEQDIQFVFDDEISNTSTFEEVITKYGQPYSFNVTTHYNDHGDYISTNIEVSYYRVESGKIVYGSYLSFYFSWDDNKIETVRYSFE